MDFGIFGFRLVAGLFAGGEIKANRGTQRDD